MLVKYHIEVTRQAIGAEFGPRALKVILRANAGQDNLLNHFGHADFHFDNNQIDESNAYIETQHNLILSSLAGGDAHAAWRSFGRMLHSVQDFYSHSDYVVRWLSRFTGMTPPQPRDIDPVSPDVHNDRGLHSGMFGHPLEILAFLPPLRNLVLPYLPADSHARMNHDGPHVSPHWEFVFHASAKRTRLEFEKITSQLSSRQLSSFIDR